MKILLLIALLFSLPSQAATIGVVDLETALSFHPLMSVFDFHHGRFLRVAPGLGATEREEQVKVLRQRAQAQQSNGASRKTRLEKELKTLEEQRSMLMIATGSRSAVISHENEQKLRLLAEDAQSRRLELEDLEVSAQYPELTTASETMGYIEKIERDVSDAIEQIAQKNNLELVLNSSLINPNAQTDISSNDQPKRSFLESDLYNRFLSLPTTDDPLEKAASLQIPWRWLQSSRYHRQGIPSWRARPMVLRGGADITDQVVSALFQKYPCASESVRVILEEIKEWKKSSPQGSQ